MKKNIKELEYISANSSYVSINYEKIDEFVEKIKGLKYSYWLDEIMMDFSEQERILFSLIYETINFCFWKKLDWIITYNKTNYKGSEAIFYALLKECEKDKNFLSFQRLQNIKYKDFKKIFTENKKTPFLLKIRYAMFKKTVRIICNKGNNLFVELYCCNSAEQLINYLTKNFTHFDDKSKFKGITIHFDKRAILLVNDLYRLSNNIRKNIITIENLTGCADYALPMIFANNGILKYHKKLERKIKNQKLIIHNSKMEIEIRANTLYVIELIREGLLKHNVTYNSVELDNVIWRLRNKEKNCISPHHTLTIYY